MTPHMGGEPKKGFRGKGAFYEKEGIRNSRGAGDRT